eukprot:11564455-Ditylum_brightwellii.AAC.1
MKNHKQGYNHHPVVTTKPNFDMQLQIEHMMKPFKTLWQSQHVKGHQSGRNLTWEAQLNNKADALGMEERTTMSPTVFKTSQSKLPTAEINLLINKNVITRSMANEIVEVYMLPYIHSNIEKCFKWNTTV